MNVNPELTPRAPSGARQHRPILWHRLPLATGSTARRRPSADDIQRCRAYALESCAAYSQADTREAKE